MKLMVALFLLLTSMSRGADRTIPVTRYHDQDLIPIHTKLRFTTLIVLPPGEEITEVSCGDKEYFVIEGRDNILHVKPAKEGAVTNLNVVLKSKAIYSFAVDEVGSKGSPDLKVVIGPDEVLTVRAEMKAMQDAMNIQAARHKQELTKQEGLRASEEIAHKTSIEELEKSIPGRLEAFLIGQRFNYICFQKTEICLAAVFSTETETYVIGELGSSPVFDGTDQNGKYENIIPFEHEGNIYKLSVPLRSGSVWQGGKHVWFTVK